MSITIAVENGPTAVEIFDGCDMCHGEDDLCIACGGTFQEFIEYDIVSFNGSTGRLAAVLTSLGINSSTNFCGHINEEDIVSSKAKIQPILEAMKQTDLESLTNAVRIELIFDFAAKHCKRILIG